MKRVKAETHLGQVDTSDIWTESFLDEEISILKADQIRRAPFGLFDVSQRERVPQRGREHDPVPFAIEQRAFAQVTLVQIGRHVK